MVKVKLRSILALLPVFTGAIADSKISNITRDTTYGGLNANSFLNFAPLLAEEGCNCKTCNLSDTFNKAIAKYDDMYGTVTSEIKNEFKNAVNGPGELFDGFKNCVGSKVCVTGPDEMCTNKMKDNLRRSIITIILEEFVKAEKSKKAPNMRTVLGKVTSETGVTDHYVDRFIVEDKTAKSMLEKGFLEALSQKVNDEVLANTNEMEKTLRIAAVTENMNFEEAAKMINMTENEVLQNVASLPNDHKTYLKMYFDLAWENLKPEREASQKGLDESYERHGYTKALNGTWVAPDAAHSTRGLFINDGMREGTIKLSFMPPNTTKSVQEEINSIEEAHTKERKLTSQKNYVKEAITFSKNLPIHVSELRRHLEDIKELCATGSNAICFARNIEDLSESLLLVAGKVSPRIDLLTELLGKVEEAVDEIDGVQKTGKKIEMTVTIASKIPYVGKLFTPVKLGMKPIVGIVTTVDKKAGLFQKAVGDVWKNTIGKVSEIIAKFDPTQIESLAGLGFAINDAYESQCARVIVKDIAKLDLVTNIDTGMGAILDYVEILTDALNSLWSALISSAWTHIEHFLNGFKTAVETVSKVFNPFKGLQALLETDIVIPWFTFPYKEKYLGPSHCDTGYRRGVLPKKLCWEKESSDWKEVFLSFNPFRMKKTCSAAGYENRFWGGCYNHNFYRRCGWWSCGLDCTHYYPVRKGKYCYRNSCASDYYADDHVCWPETRPQLYHVAKCGRYTVPEGEKGEIYAATLSGNCYLGCSPGDSYALGLCWPPAEIRFSIQDIFDALQKALDWIKGIPGVGWVLEKIEEGITFAVEKILSPITSIIKEWLKDLFDFPDFPTIDLNVLPFLSFVEIDVELPELPDLSPILEPPKRLINEIKNLDLDEMGIGKIFDQIKIPPETFDLDFISSVSDLYNSLDSIQCEKWDNKTVSLDAILKDTFDISLSDPKACDTTIPFCTRFNLEALYDTIELVASKTAHWFDDDEMIQSTTQRSLTESKEKPIYPKHKNLLEQFISPHKDDLDENGKKVDHLTDFTSPYFIPFPFILSIPKKYINRKGKFFIQQKKFTLSGEFEFEVGIEHQLGFLIEQTPNHEQKRNRKVSLAIQPSVGGALTGKVQSKLFSNELKMIKDFVSDYESNTAPGKPWLKIWPCFDEKNKKYSLKFLEKLYGNKQKIPKEVLSACEDAEKAFEIATGKSDSVIDWSFHSKCKHSKLNEYLEKLMSETPASQDMLKQAKICTKGWFKKKDEIEKLVEEAENVLIIKPPGSMCNFLKDIKIDTEFFLGGANPSNGVKFINGIGLSFPDPNFWFNKIIYDTSNDDCPLEYSVSNTFTDKFVRNPLHCTGENCKDFDFTKPLDRDALALASWSAGEYHLKCIKIPGIKHAYELGMKKLGCDKSLMERYSDNKGEKWIAQKESSEKMIPIIQKDLDLAKNEEEKAEQNLEKIKKTINIQKGELKSANEKVKETEEKIVKKDKDVEDRESKIEGAKYVLKGLKNDRDFANDVRKELISERDTFEKDLHDLEILKIKKDFVKKALKLSDDKISAKKEEIKRTNNELKKKDGEIERKNKELEKKDKEITDSESKLVVAKKDLADANEVIKRLESEKDTFEENLGRFETQKKAFERLYNEKKEARDKKEKELNKEKKTLKQAEKEIIRLEHKRKQILLSYQPLHPESPVNYVELETFVFEWWNEEKKWEDVYVGPNNKHDKSSYSPELQPAIKVVAEYPIKLFDITNLQPFEGLERAQLGGFYKRGEVCDSTKIYDQSDPCAYRFDCMMRMCGDGICDTSCGEDGDKCEGDCASASPSTMPSTSTSPSAMPSPSPSAMPSPSATTMPSALPSVGPSNSRI